MSKIDVKINLEDLIGKPFRFVTDNYSSVKFVRHHYALNVYNYASGSASVGPVWLEYRDNIIDPQGQRVIGYQAGGIIYLLGNTTVKTNRASIVYRGNIGDNGTGPHYQDIRKGTSTASGAVYLYRESTGATGRTVQDPLLGGLDTLGTPDLSTERYLYFSPTEVSLDPTGSLSKSNNYDGSRPLTTDPATTPVRFPAKSLHMITASAPRIRNIDIPDVTTTPTVGYVEVTDPKLIGDMFFTAVKSIRDSADVQTLGVGEQGGVNTQFTVSTTTYSTQIRDGVGCAPIGLIVSSDLDACKKFIEDGTIPDDATAITGEDGEEGGDGSGSSDDDVDDAEPSEPDETSATLSNAHVYWLSKDDMQTFYDVLWDIDWTDVLGNFVGLYSNVISNVISVRYFPAPAAVFDVGDPGNVILGNKTLEFAPSTLGGKTHLITLGSYTFKRHFGNFMDYDPYTSAELYLPLHGVIPIDVNLFMGRSQDAPKTLTVKASYDIMAGSITYFVLRGATILYSVQANLGSLVPVSLQDGAEFFANAATRIADATAAVGKGVATGTAVGAAFGVANGLTNLGGAELAPMRLVNGGSGDGALYGVNQCMIIIRRPEYQKPKKYEHILGYPDYGYRKISSHSGFVQAINPQLTFEHMHPTSRELDEIKSLLSAGVYV